MVSMRNNPFEQTKLRKKSLLKYLKLIKSFLVVTIMFIGLIFAILQTELENSARDTVESIYNLADNSGEYEYIWQTYNADGSIYSQVVIQKDENKNYYVRAKSESSSLVEAYLIDRTATVFLDSTLKSTSDLSMSAEQFIKNNTYAFLFTRYDDFINSDIKGESIKSDDNIIIHSAKKYKNDNVIGKESFYISEENMSVKYINEFYEDKNDSWSESVTIKDIGTIEPHATV